MATSVWPIYHADSSQDCEEETGWLKRGKLFEFLPGESQKYVYSLKIYLLILSEAAEAKLVCRKTQAPLNGSLLDAPNISTFLVPNAIKTVLKFALKERQGI